MANKANKPDYFEYFPYKELRPEQRQVLDILAKNWDNPDKKYYILQLGVGVGKSGIAMTAANMSEDAFILTKTKQLQDQYMSDFGECCDIIDIKGRANYPCNINPKLNCECGLCVMLTDPSDAVKLPCRDDCLYYSRRAQALASHTVVTSYAYLFRAFDCAKFWRKRDLAVFDECHLLEDELVGFAEFTLNPNELQKRFKLFDGIKNPSQLKRLKQKFSKSGITQENMDRLREFYDLAYSKRADLFTEMQDKFLSCDISRPEDIDADTLELISKTHRVYYELDKFVKQLDIYYETSKFKNAWLIHLDSDNWLKFTPLFVNSLFNYCVKYKVAQRYIFMSATIFDIEGFITEFGLKRDEVVFINVESTFDPNKSPIKYIPCGKMTYNEWQTTLPAMYKTINTIMDVHYNDKGIIHTGNYKIAKNIYDELNKKQDERFIYRTSTEISNAVLLKEHSEEDRPTVLLSPSMTTGVDLKDDLSRFQIIAKLPFQSLGDIRVSTKAKIKPNWYAMNMLRSLVQSAGRSTRSAEDHSTTYILDSSFLYWFSMYQKMLPNDFIHRLKMATI